MRRFRWLAPVVVFAAVGCGDTPTVVTNTQTAAQQEAAQKQADEEEQNMKNGAYDPAAPKKAGKPKK
jgi:GTP cyclohydrolase III